MENYIYIFHISGGYMAIKKIATNLPDDLLKEAIKATGLNQTATIIEGLKELIARERREQLLKLKGTMDLDLNLFEVRQRKKVQK
jgi:hypothetical protein